MNNYSYLVTFSNLFERKYFDEHLEEFFINSPVVLNYPTMKENVVYHSNKFIEIGSKYSFNPHTLLTKFPNAKITRKVVKGRSAKYYPVKAT